MYGLLLLRFVNSQYGSTSYEPGQSDRIDSRLAAGSGSWGRWYGGWSESIPHQEEILAMWAAFDQQVEAPSQTSLPFGFTIGNHDASAALAVSGKYLFPKSVNGFLVLEQF